jgi:hypothetical protein
MMLGLRGIRIICRVSVGDCVSLASRRVLSNTNKRRLVLAVEA